MMIRKLATMTFAVLTGILPARAEFRQIDLTVFGMD
jgi:hypothetical protein